MEKVKRLTELKNHIESLDKHHQTEILKILSKNMCKINENKIILGLTNVHFRFGHISILQYLKIDNLIHHIILHFGAPI